MSGSVLCLDYVNTRYWRGQPQPTETLNGPDDLVAWTTATLARDAKPLPRREFERAVEARETIWRVFDATARAKPPAAADVAALNALLAETPPRATLHRDRAGYAWDLELRTGSALSLLAPVLWSAGDLLTGGQLDRVRRCANPECGWLFVDHSRAGRRRWCSMQSCGNRAKARRHYYRSREA